MRKQMTINQTAQLLTVKETALTLGVSTRTVTRLIASGDLESVTIGRCRRIRTTAISRFVDDKQKQHRQQVVGF
jgi:excisionase family DNA binding protein